MSAAIRSFFTGLGRGVSSVQRCAVRRFGIAGDAGCSNNAGGGTTNVGTNVGTTGGAAGCSDNGGKGQPFRVTLIEGDGFGPTLCASVRKIFKAADVPVQWERHTMRVSRNPLTGRQTVNADVVNSAMETGLVLRGPSAGSSQDGLNSLTALILYKALDAFIGVRLFASIDGHQPFGHIRMINVRDNVTGEYSEIEHSVTPGNNVVSISSLKSGLLCP